MIHKILDSIQGLCLCMLIKTVQFQLLKMLRILFSFAWIELRVF